MVRVDGTKAKKSLVRVDRCGCYEELGVRFLHLSAYRFVRIPTCGLIHTCKRPSCGITRWGLGFFSDEFGRRNTRGSAGKLMYAGVLGRVSA